VVEETTLLEEIQRNGMKEQELIKEIEKEDGEFWEKDRIVYMDGRIYVLNNKKLKEKIL